MGGGEAKKQKTKQTLKFFNKEEPTKIWFDCEIFFPKT